MENFRFTPFNGITLFGYGVHYRVDVVSGQGCSFSFFSSISTNR
jgi:hypothetical protein